MTRRAMLTAKKTARKMRTTQAADWTQRGGGREKGSMKGHQQEGSPSQQQKRATANKQCMYLCMFRRVVPADVVAMVTDKSIGKSNLTTAASID